MAIFLAVVIFAWFSISPGDSPSIDSPTMFKLKVEDRVFGAMAFSPNGQTLAAGNKGNGSD